LTALQHQMKDIWSEVLPRSAMDLHVITAASDFFHVGGTSMLLAQLQKRVADSFNADIPLIRYFEKSTLAEMAELTQTHMHDFCATTTIDWKAETATTMSALTQRPTKKSKPMRGKTIILTGATGFLGRRLLKRLSDVSAVGTIHCLAVREHHSNHRSWSPPSTKVHIHYGDLSQADLGVGEEILSSIFSQSDAIIHNAADVSFMKSYQSLRPTNVTATQTLANLAYLHHVAFHYVSTSGVAHLSGLPEFAEVSAGPFPPPTDGSDGYVASKWASERYLENLNAATGLPVWIHRPSSIMGDNAASTDLMGSLFAYSLKLGAVPLLSSLGSVEKSGYADLIDVDRVADGILQHLEKKQDMRNSLIYVHHSGEMVIPIQALVGDEGNEQNQGLGLKSMPLHEWVGNAKNAGLNELIAELL
ncbi:non-ribosomal peptide synthase, partial [Periconia macrospinosa]